VIPPTYRPERVVAWCGNIPPMGIVEEYVRLARRTEDRMSDTPTRGYAGSKDDSLRRLRRVEGQVRGLQRLVEEDTYCIDVLTQISAATRALEAVALGLLEDHLAHCVTNAVRAGGSEADEKLKEASAAIARLVRS
jgi:CsoR family transcriptional regulator, copper-sensing transcriptional repressor